MNEQILRNAIEKFGFKSQRMKAIEEMAELTRELCHFPDDPENLGAIEHSKLVSEIADVLIMTSQLRLIYGPEKVDEQIECKLKRLEILSTNLNELMGEQKGIH